MNVESWNRQIEVSRRQEDPFSAGHPQSPLPFHDRAEFTGLSCYPPDPDYRFELPLHERGDKPVSRLQDTAGQERPLIRWGEFRFKIKDEFCSLHAYRNEVAEARLFIPFRHKTSGDETYRAGCYLDLEPEAGLTEDGLWIVDLNAACSPWRAYSERFVCPFVPSENWPSVPARAVEAGANRGVTADLEERLKAAEEGKNV